jgi:uncharacterized phage infection (PIP) family protein YhgE
MGYQPRKSRRHIDHEFTKPYREKSKNKLRASGRAGKSEQEQMHVPTAKEVSEETLKRLHTIGNQKFGSSPFSAHFDRWLFNAKNILEEFESNPNITIDEEFQTEVTQILSTIEKQFEQRRRSEKSLDQEAKDLQESKNQLEKIKNDYLTAARQLETRRNREIKRLSSSIDDLRNDQNEVIRMKTGFLRGVPRKERERKEMEITQRLADEQQALELTTLEFKSAKEKLRDEYETKTVPISNQIRKIKKKLEDAETDDSLEDRWFACEALIDAVNNLLQRKSASNTSSPET